MKKDEIREIIKSYNDWFDAAAIYTLLEFRDKDELLDAYLSTLPGEQPAPPEAVKRWMCTMPEDVLCPHPDGFGHIGCEYYQPSQP